MNNHFTGDELIALFRAEAVRRRNGQPTKRDSEPRPNLPIVRDLPSMTTGSAGQVNETLDRFPTVSWWRSVDPKIERLKSLTSEAKERSGGPKGLPKFLRSLFRRQGSVNRALIESNAMLAKTNEQLVKQGTELQNAFQAQSRWLEGLSRQLGGGPTTLIYDDLIALRTVLRPLLQDLQVRLNDLTEQLHNADLRSTDQTEELRETRWNLLNLAEDVATLGGELKNVARSANEAQQVEAAVNKLRNDVETGHVELRNAFRSIAELGETLARTTSLLGTKADAAFLTELEERVAARAAAVVATKADTAFVTRVEERNVHDLDFIKSEVTRVEERNVHDLVFIKSELSSLRAAMERLPKRQSAKRVKPLGGDDDDDHSEFDSFYLAFENEFRGDRRKIKDRIKVYLPFLARANAVEGLLDLGCGRGEWLELLVEQRLANISGVDLNRAMIEECVGRGLPAIYGDALEHLRTLGDGTFSAITSFHLIEHLNLHILLLLFAEIHRTLRPGGIAILETPNPRNILVGASDFFRDPTHHHPIHPDTLRFFCQAIGFANVGCYFLEGSDERTAIPASDFTFANLESYVDVPRDFAVIAHKA